MGLGVEVVLMLTLMLVGLRGMIQEREKGSEKRLVGCGMTSIV